MTTSGTMEMRSVSLRVRLGVFPGETITERDVPVDVTWTGEHSPIPGLDYDRVCEVLIRPEGSRYRYIEELAEELLRDLLQEFPAGRWRVSVRKPHPPSISPMESVTYTLEGGPDD